MHVVSDTTDEETRQLADYYVAAVEFIDPDLALSASLAEIASAVELRQAELKEQPMAEVREEYSQLTEALLFIQRTHPKLELAITPPPPQLLVDDSPEVAALEQLEATMPIVEDTQLPEVITEPELPEPPSQDAVAEHEIPSELDLPGVADLQVEEVPAGQLSVSSPEEGSPVEETHEPRWAELPIAEPIANTETVPEPAIDQLVGPVQAITTAEDASPVTDRSQALEPDLGIVRLSEVLEQARIAAVESPVELEIPPGEYQPPPRRSSVVAVPKEVHHQPAEQLPEIEAWPVLRGILLVGWQLWLAGFSGWTAVRLTHWPYAGYHDTPWWQLGLLVLLGVAVALGVGWGNALYRVRSWRIMLPAILSTLAILLNLAAWWFAGVRNEITSMHPPGWSWGLAICACLVLLVVAFVYDLRVAARR